MNDTAFIVGVYFGGKVKWDEIAEQERVVDEWVIIGVASTKERAIEACQNPGDFWIEVQVDKFSPSGEPEEIVDFIEDGAFPHGRREQESPPDNA